MRIAIITGASSGMGAEFVRQCAADWDGLEEIWILARRRERLETLKREVEASFHSFGPVIRPFVLDITEQSEREAFFAQVKQETPQVRLLINCAGVGKNGLFGSETCGRETDMVRLNCEALLAMTYGVLPYLRSGSHIMHMASAAAFTPQPEFAVYAATKAFVYSFSRALAQELKGRGIYVTAVCPGPVDTEFLNIAGSGKPVAWYKRFVMAKAGPVVKQAIRDAQKGKTESIYGLPMKLCKAAGKLLPWNIILMLYRKK